MRLSITASNVLSSVPSPNWRPSRSVSSRSRASICSSSLFTIRTHNSYVFSLRFGLGGLGVGRRIRLALLSKAWGVPLFGTVQKSLGGNGLITLMLRRSVVDSRGNVKLISGARSSNSAATLVSVPFRSLMFRPIGPPKHWSATSQLSSFILFKALGGLGHSNNILTVVSPPFAGSCVVRSWPKFSEGTWYAVPGWPITEYNSKCSFGISNGDIQCPSCC